MTGAESMAAVTAICLGFASVHSTLVTKPVKVFASRLFGESFVRTWYRFLFIVVSVVTLAITVALIRAVPDVTVFHPPLSLVIAMRCVQLAAVVFASRAFKALDFLEFIGISQALRAISGQTSAGDMDMEGMTKTQLVTTGVYGVVRHPLYFAGIVIMTFSPTLTRNWITVSVLSDLYFIFGAFIEERRYIRDFGEEYLRYMKEVPRLLPRVRLFRKRF